MSSSGYRGGYSSSAGLLTPDEAAALLKVPKSTLMRWVQQGKIATRYKQDRLLFPMEGLEPIIKALGLDPRPSAAAAAEPLDFVDVFRRGGLVLGLNASTKEELLRMLVENAPIQEGIDKKELSDRIIEREKIASTVVAPGIAVPHPRRPLVGVLSHSSITTAVLDPPFKGFGVDGETVKCLFMLLSKNRNDHLQLLGLVARLAKSKGFISGLGSVRDLESLLEMLREELAFG